MASIKGQGLRDHTGPPVPGWGGVLHHGFQCEDPLARDDFRKFLAEEYGTAAALNTAWGTAFADFGAEFILNGIIG